MLIGEYETRSTADDDESIRWFKRGYFVLSLMECHHH